MSPYAAEKSEFLWLALPAGSLADWFAAVGTIFAALIAIVIAFFGEKIRRLQNDEAAKNLARLLFVQSNHRSVFKTTEASEPGQHGREFRIVNLAEGPMSSIKIDMRRDKFDEVFGCGKYNRIQIFNLDLEGKRNPGRYSIGLVHEESYILPGRGLEIVFWYPELGKSDSIPVEIEFTAPDGLRWSKDVDSFGELHRRK